MLNNVTKSVVFAKYIVGVTGLVLVLFILGHTMGNTLIYLGPEAINSYAKNLRAVPEILWIVRIGLIVSTVLHVWLSLKLTAMNRAANPQKYKVNNHKRATFASKSMRFLGMSIFFFVIYHLAHYTFGMVHPEHHALVGDNYNAYDMLVAGFSVPWIAGIYLLAVIFLGFHLSHGIQSMAHTLGINGDTASPMIKKISNLIAVVVTVGLGSIPVSVLTGLVGG